MKKKMHLNKALRENLLLNEKDPGPVWIVSKDSEAAKQLAETRVKPAKHQERKDRR